MKRRTKILVGAGVGLAVVGGIGLALGGGGAEEKWPSGEPPPRALAVGDEKDPEIAALLQEMRDEFVSGGVDLSLITPEEVTRMAKAPGRPLAIPPRAYWPRMVRTIVRAYQPVRRWANVPFTITSGYRTPDYNKAVTCTEEVGGVCVEWQEGSRHQFFEAIDFIPKTGAPELALEYARLYLDEGDDIHLGLGTYGFPANRFHIDTGFRKRTWGETKRYIQMARAA